MRTRFALSILWTLALPLQAAAHGGGLDGNGCHHNRKTGDYHCHRAPRYEPTPSTPTLHLVPPLSSFGDRSTVSSDVASLSARMALLEIEVRSLRQKVSPPEGPETVPSRPPDSDSRFLASNTAFADEHVPPEGTQAGTNAAAGQRLEAAEIELGLALATLVDEGKAKPEAIAMLRQSQAAWESFRDAQLHLLWPFPEKTSYGSVHAMCVAGLKAQLTEARVQELQGMLSWQEGDVCMATWPE